MSELIRQEPNPHVIIWMDEQLGNDLFITSITIAEIKLGVALLPKGKRKSILAGLVDGMLQEFSENQLYFDDIAAIKYANIASQCVKEGRPISTEDAQIASISSVHNAVLVTRNTRDFEMIEGLEIFNPFI